MNDSEAIVANAAIDILNEYKVPKYRYTIFEELDDSLSLQKEGDCYKLYYIERGKKKLLIESKNVKFAFSYLIMICILPQHKYEARKKFIDKVKEEK